MFAFLIDDSAWVEIGGEQFAPGFFVWNSEVGRRTIGVETFWFQHVCANHIVWDAIELRLAILDSSFHCCLINCQKIGLGNASWVKRSRPLF